MVWNLYEKEKFLDPLRFSNGKTQEDIVRDVLDLIEKGKKIIFIKGVCGTGKSAIALNIARNIGQASIIVPGKTLQNQYKVDYEGDKYLLKANGEKLKINVMTGRNNHKCKFLEDKELVIPTQKKEVDSKLSDIFSFSKKEKEEKRREDLSADKYDLPCKIELKKNNFYKIKAYLKQNKHINSSKIHDIGDVKRIGVASICPYWSPVIPEEYELKIFENATQRKYTGLDNNKFIFYHRKPGCKFYEQFNYYIDSDAIVFNSMKYKLESALNRKPATEVEIIDECDEFLDSFSNQRTISLTRLQHALNYVFPEDKLGGDVLDDLHIELSNMKKDKKLEAAVYSKMILPIKETRLYNLLRILLNNSEFMNCVDDENYLIDVEETARLFEDFFEETYLTFTKKDNNIIISLVTTNLAKRFKEMVDKNKIIVLMSGTIHSSNVLRDIFGLEEFDIIEAEVTDQGSIEIKKTGLEKDCKYSNFANGNNSRESYLKALDECIKVAEKPVLIQVNSFGDLPSREEINNFDLECLPNREELRETQREDKQGKLVDEFKDGKTDILFSTKCSRGMDFPGEKCRSIIFTKYPNPDVKSAFWKILKQTKPQYYWEFYKDKAERELLQRIYRGLRFKEDHIYLLSPDTRVLNYFEKKNNC
jgi:Rad3-related DNA helicase